MSIIAGVAGWLLLFALIGTLAAMVVRPRSKDPVETPPAHRVEDRTPRPGAGDDGIEATR